MNSYFIRKTAAPVDPAAAWDSPVWSSAETATLTHTVGPECDHRPLVEVKLLHDGSSIYGFFQVHDQFVRAVAPCDQACVCCDSCVEFFVQPAGSPRYFNFEMNCGGRMLLYAIRNCRTGDLEILPQEVLDTVKRCHTLPDTVEPEIADPVFWQLRFVIPAALFVRFAGIRPELSGQVWHGNFTKCADQSSHPHWLTWMPLSRFDFHVPAEFGELRFE